MDKNYLPYLKRLSNQLFPVAYEQVCTKLDEKEIAAENVQLSFENAKEVVEELKFLKKMRIPHRLTKTLSLKKNERHQFLLSLRGRVNYFLKSPSVEERNAAEVLNQWLNGYSESFKNPTIDGQTSTINNMKLAILKREDLSESITVLGLSGTMDSLAAYTSGITRDKKTRSDDNKAVLRKAEILRQDAYKRMETLWKSLEVAIEVDPENADMYKDCLASITWEMTGFKAVVLSNETRRKNAKLKAEEENANPEDGEDTNSTDVEGENRTMHNLIPMNGVEGQNDLTTEQTSMQSKTMNGSAVHTIPVNGNLEHDTAVKPEVVNAEQKTATNGSDRASKNESLDS